MKRAVLLHGTDGSPEGNWFPWLKQKLESEGYEVWAPLLPENHTPNKETYNNFLLRSDWDFTNNLIIGHSSGAVSVLNLLMDERCPHVKLGVMVSAWATMNITEAEKHQLKELGLDAEQFKDLFPHKGFNFKRINSHADKLAFLHSDDDPYCPLRQAQWLAKQLDAPITVMHEAHHIGSKYTELPEVWQLIKPSL